MVLLPHCYWIFILNICHSVLIKIVLVRISEVLNRTVVVEIEEGRDLNIPNTEFPGK